ncbi:hypothetical protein AAG570_011695 [Ranatra chinensis]|uniref:SMB domain-containing protein n=1 Tax=Ranatra chinensis TaxID=642074 RepID=A0ABD0YV35_9HEMI
MADNEETSYGSKIFIEGVTGPGYTGDIAIDDLHFSDSVDCIDDKDYMSCEGRCGEDPTIHQRACHCHNDCHEFGACCYNYVDVCTAEKSTTAWPGSESSYKSETTPYPIFNSSISLLTSVSLDSEPTQGSLDSDQYNTDDTRTDLVVDFTGTTDVTNFSLVPITKSPSVDSVSSSFPPSGQAEEYGTQRSLEIDVSPSIHPVTGLLLEPTSTEVMQSAHGLVSMTNATVIPVTKEHNTTVVADTSNHNVTLILPNLINKLNLTTAKTYRLAPTTTLPPAGPNVRIGTFSVVGINITLPALNLTPKSTIRSILPTSFAIPTPKSLNPISAILPNRQNKTFPPPVPTGVMFPRVGKQNPTTVTLFPPALNATFPALSLTMAGSQTTVSASKNTTILPVMLATLLPSTLNLTVEPIKPTLGIFPSVPLDPNITSPPVVITSTHFPFSIRTTSPTHLSSKAVKTLLFPTTPRISAGVKLPALIGAGPVSDSDTKWKSKFTPKGRYKFSARISEKDSSGQSSLAVGAVVIVCIVVASLAASTAWWLVRRRSHSLSYLRGNGRNTDGASDVLFLAADEILDFSIPGVDTGHSQQHQFAESTR